MSWFSSRSFRVALLGLLALVTAVCKSVLGPGGQEPTTRAPAPPAASRPSTSGQPGAGPGVEVSTRSTGPEASSPRPTPPETSGTARSPAGGGASPAQPAPRSAGVEPGTTRTGPAPDPVRQPRIGFRTQAALDDHFEKHGQEFGSITKAEYLRRAQVLRDAAVAGAVLELRRADGVVSRFDRKTGAFLAFNPDLTIRTFFRPNDGEAYFRRQAEREH